jgi:cation transport regulator ChaC
MEKTGSRIITTTTSIILTDEEVSDILKAHVGLYGGEVVYVFDVWGNLKEATVTETHTEVISTP